MTTKKQIVFETEWFSLEAQQRTDIDSMRSKPFYRLNVPDSVVVLAFTPEQRVVLVKQYRPAIDRYTLELPAGCVDPNEAPEKAAVRELFEESGYHCESLQYVHQGGGAVDRLNTTVFLYFANNAKRDPKFVPEPGIEVVTLSLAEFKNEIMKMDYINYPVLGALILAQWKLNPTELSHLGSP